MAREAGIAGVVDAVAALPVGRAVECATAPATLTSKAAMLIEIKPLIRVTFMAGPHSMQDCTADIQYAIDQDDPSVDANVADRAQEWPFRQRWADHDQLRKVAELILRVVPSARHAHKKHPTTNEG